MVPINMKDNNNINKVCIVCGITNSDPADEGIFLNDGSWICCVGCWCDFHMGKAILKEKDKKEKEELIEGINKTIKDIIN
jgi:hypothetical protein